MVGNLDVKQALRVRDGDPTDVPNALRPRHQPSIGTRRLRIVGAEYPLLAKPLQCPRTVEEAGGATLPFHGAFEKFSLQRPVEELFALLQDAVRRNAARIEVSYDERYGYPQNCSSTTTSAWRTRRRDSS